MAVHVPHARVGRLEAQHVVAARPDRVRVGEERVDHVALGDEVERARVRQCASRDDPELIAVNVQRVDLGGRTEPVVHDDEVDHVVQRHVDHLRLEVRLGRRAACACQARDGGGRRARAR